MYIFYLKVIGLLSAILGKSGNELDRVKQMPLFIRKVSSLYNYHFLWQIFNNRQLLSDIPKTVPIYFIYFFKYISINEVVHVFETHEINVFNRL